MAVLEVGPLNMCGVHAMDINECSKWKVSGRNDWVLVDDLILKVRKAEKKWLISEKKLSWNVYFPNIVFI